MSPVFVFFLGSTAALLVAGVFLACTARRGGHRSVLEPGASPETVETSPVLLAMLTGNASDLLLVLEADGEVLWASPSVERPSASAGTGSRGTTSPPE